MKTNSNVCNLKFDDLIQCIKELSNDDSLKETIESYSKPSLWSIIYNKRDGSADELAYSRFLSWLLHPKENHGLENKFAELLVDYLSNNKNHTLPVAKPIEGSEIAHCETEALGQSIDIVYRNDKMGRAIIIENKTGTELHLSNYGQEKRTDRVKGKYCQLEKYFDVVKDDSVFNVSPQYKEEAKAIRNLPKIYIFLHPEGITPADSIERTPEVQKVIRSRDEDWENSPWIKPWISISYEDISNVLRTLLNETSDIEDDTKRLINEFIVDSKRQLDSKLKEEVKKLIFGEDAGNIKKDTGVLLSEIMAAIKVMDIDIIEDDLDGAYKEVEKKLIDLDLSGFKSSLEKELNDPKNKITKKQAENVIRYLWNLKPKVVKNTRVINEDVQELICKLFDYFTNENWSEESDNWKNVKKGYIAKIREDLAKKLGVNYIRRTDRFGQGVNIFTINSTNANEKDYKNLKDDKADVYERYYISGDSYGYVPNDGFSFERKEKGVKIKPAAKNLNSYVPKEKASHWLENFPDFISGVIDGIKG